jgi:hypothetical protein
MSAIVHALHEAMKQGDRYVEVDLPPEADVKISSLLMILTSYPAVAHW